MSNSMQNHDGDVQEQEKDDDELDLPTYLLVEKFISFPVCLLSMIGAAMVMSAVFRSKQNRANMQQRIMGFMSISDFMLPFMRVTGYLWLPKDQGSGYIGNEITCDVQGFLNVLWFSSTVGYNGILALYYLLVIRYNFKPHRLQKIDKYLYLAPYANAIFWAILAVALNTVNPPEAYYATNICSVQRDIDYALENGFDDPKYLFNARRESVLWIAFALMYILIIVFNILAISLIYIHVRKTEKRSLRWRSINEIKLEKTKIVATQFKLFAVVFLVPAFFYIITNLLKRTGVAVPEWCQALSISIVYIGGLLNASVYFRKRFRRLCRENPDWYKITIVWKIVHDTLFPCTCTCYNNHDDDGASLNNAASARMEESGDCEPELEECLEPVEEQLTSSLRTINQKKSSTTSTSRKTGTCCAAAKGTSWRELKMSGVQTINKTSISLTGGKSKTWRELKTSGVQTIDKNNKVKRPEKDIEANNFKC